MPVGKLAPPRPRRPEAFITLTMASRPVSMIALVPSQSPRRRARPDPVVQAVEVGEDAVLVGQHMALHLPVSVEPAFGRGMGARDLGAAPRRLAARRRRAGR